MKKFLGIAAMVAMMISMFAVPASADKTEAGVLQGTANVGDSFDQTCDDTGAATATGKGLYAPTLQPGNPTGTYSLHANLLASAPNGLGDLDVCGELRKGSVTQVGASCLSSEGHSGKGQVSWTKGTYKLNNVGWPQSAGGFLPVTGEVTDPTQPSKAVGTLVAAIYATGGSECFEQKPGDGATQFTVVGAFAATNAV